jgi:hypothetical protein
VAYAEPSDDDARAVFRVQQCVQNDAGAFCAVYIDRAHRRRFFTFGTTMAMYSIVGKASLVTKIDHRKYLAFLTAIQTDP